MVARFIRIMCSPQLQSSVCSVVLLVMMVRVELWSSGGTMGGSSTIVEECCGYYGWCVKVGY